MNSAKRQRLAALGRNCRFLTIAVALCLGLNLAWAGDSNASLTRVTMENYRSREVNADGSTAWSLFGREAVITGARALLKRVQAHLFQEQIEYILFTPACTYEKDSHALRSNDRVHVHSSRLTMDGEGFDADLVTRRLTIRRNVRLMLYNSPIDLLGNAPQKE